MNKIWPFAHLDRRIRSTWNEETMDLLSVLLSIYRQQLILTGSQREESNLDLNPNVFARVAIIVIEKRLRRTRVIGWNYGESATCPVKETPRTFSGYVNDSLARRNRVEGGRMYEKLSNPFADWFMNFLSVK